VLDFGEWYCLLIANLVSYFNDDQPARTVSPQQTRNIVAKLLGLDAADKHLMAMLRRFSMQDGNEVLVMHDQLKMVCGVVLQSRIQKVFIQQWGQTLAMDWTHGTNNLGFYLGKSQMWQIGEHP
jgi:CBS-domain-containing membrane protein